MRCSRGPSDHPFRSRPPRRYRLCRSALRRRHAGTGHRALAVLPRPYWRWRRLYHSLAAACPGRPARRRSIVCWEQWLGARSTWQYGAQSRQQAPELLCLIIARLGGACLYLSLPLRHPRQLCVSAGGYTVAFIGLSRWYRRREHLRHAALGNGRMSHPRHRFLRQPGSTVVVSTRRCPCCCRARRQLWLSDARRLSQDVLTGTRYRTGRADLRLRLPPTLSRSTRWRPSGLRQNGRHRRRRTRRVPFICIADAAAAAGHRSGIASRPEGMDSTDNSAGPARLLDDSLANWVATEDRSRQTAYGLLATIAANSRNLMPARHGSDHDRQPADTAA